jgi:hypothetical protein
MTELLHLENACGADRPVTSGFKRSLFVSLNPDLINDFGHFLNYEKRLREACSLADIEYVCFANDALTIDDSALIRVFKQDSGYFSLTRGSAVNEEKRISLELRDAVTSALQKLGLLGRHHEILLFLYCGSSSLAVTLAEQSWDSRIRVCINAFWDFLLPAARPVALSSLRLQKTVRLLAMSDLHADRLLAHTGLHFNSIPNPPPLLDDVRAYEEIRTQMGGLVRPLHTRVLVPGLMTIGKGKDSTLALFEVLQRQKTGGLEFVFRDRKRELPANEVSGVTVISGDLTDDGIVDLYRQTDFVYLPYDAATFGIRTSGALVDCLMFGAIPLVLQGTWLEHICERFDVGYVLADAQPETVFKAIDSLANRMYAERARVLIAGARYLSEHSWGHLLDVVREDDGHPVVAVATKQREQAPTLLAAGNKLLRDGHYEDAARVYEWLRAESPLKLYDFNFRLCQSRISQTPQDLLRTTA